MSGPDRYIQQLARFLPEEGYDMEILLLDDGFLSGGSHHFNHIKRLCGAQVRVASLSSCKSALPKVIKYLLERIKARPISLLHTHEFKSDIIGWAVAKITGIPQIVTDHGQSREDLLSMRFFRAAGMLAAKNSARVLAPSHHQFQLLLSQGVPEEKISLVYNGVDAELLPSAPEIGKARIRAAIGIGEHEFVILSLARLDPQKDQETLINSFALVTRSYPNARLLLVGSGEEKWRNHLQNLAQNLQIAEKILFLGFREDICSLLQACDLFVISSRLENFPYSLIEAMLFGKPIVSTRVGGVPELLGESIGGLLVKPGDADEMSRAILLLIEQPRLASSLAASAHHIAKEQFGGQVMAQRVAVIYDTVCRKGAL